MYYLRIIIGGLFPKYVLRAKYMSTLFLLMKIRFNKNIISHFIEYYITYRITFYNNYLLLITACVAQLTKASDIQAIGYGFEPRPDH